MLVHDILDQIAGDWTGVNLLRLLPTDPYRESDARATVTSTAHGNFLTFTYTWADQGTPQDGLLLIGAGDKPDTAEAAWVDSWHQNRQWMLLDGSANDGGVIQLNGTYADNAWGWRVNLDPTDGTRLRLTMDNIPPDEDAYQAVEATFTRTA